MLDVDPAARARLRFLRCGHGTNLELFEYEAPEQAKRLPRNSDHGGHHLAFYVDDMDAAVPWLRARGVEVMGEPELVTEGPSAGTSWVYFRAPWGLQLELVSYPAGKASERQPGVRLWHPGRPGR
jgi:catechol 2,3-dioxygenase-like lactoylglutathione lyase family enzyme